MIEKKTILIFGLSSFIGSSLAWTLKDEYRIIGTYFHHKIEIDGVLSFRCAINDNNLIKLLISYYQADFVFYCVGLYDLNIVSANRRLAEELNSRGLYTVSNFSEIYRSKLIYFSTHFVFSGEEDSYKEEDSPSPVTLLGNIFASSEFFIQKSCLNYIIFRIPYLIGRSFSLNKRSLLEKLEYLTFNKEEVKLDNKIKFGFVSTRELSIALFYALKNNLTNKVLHISSKDSLTFFEFAKMYLELRGIRGKLVEEDLKFPVSSQIFSPLEEGKLSLSLSTDMSNEILKMKPFLVRETLYHFLNESKKREEKDFLKII